MAQANPALHSVIPYDWHRLRPPMARSAELRIGQRGNNLPGTRAAWITVRPGPRTAKQVVGSRSTGEGSSVVKEQATVVAPAPRDRAVVPAVAAGTPVADRVRVAVGARGEPENDTRDAALSVCGS